MQLNNQTLIDSSSCSFSQLDHHDMLIGNIFPYCSMYQLIREIMPVCRRWFSIGLELEIHFKKKKTFNGYFANAESNWDKYCDSLESHFVTDLYLSKPSTKIIETMINGSSFRKLKKLTMSSCSQDQSENISMLEMVAKSEIAKNIHSLEFDSSKIGDEGLKIISESIYFNNLTKLRLRFCDITIDGFKLLASNPKFSNIVKITLTEINDEGFKYFCESPNFSHVEYLDLTVSYISDSGLRYFASSQYLKKVKSLIFENNDFTGEGVKILCEADNIESVEYLEFEYTPIGDEGVKYLTQSPKLRNLKYLGIASTDTGDESARYIADSPLLQNLKELYYIHDFYLDPFYHGKVMSKEGEQLLSKFKDSNKLIEA